MEKRINLFNILREEGKLETLHVYASTEAITDPYEKTTSTVYMNPLSIKALVRQVSPEALHWKYFGSIPFGSIEIITEKKNKTLFKTADKIKYNEEYYKCWKNDEKGFSFLERQDYIIVILTKKVL